jgi:hypothetical protein
MQMKTRLSMTEADLVASLSCAQDLLFEKKVLELVGLKV